MSTSGVAAAAAEQPKKRHSPWLWVSIGLAILAIGLFVWALKSRSDLDSAQQDVKDLQAQVEQGQQKGSAIAASVNDVVGDLQGQLSSTSADLATSEQKVKDAQATASQAKSQAEAANAKLDVAAACAESYVEAFKALASGQTADEVKQQLQTITADCKGALR